jgi:undecaprenyl-diphosphatase
LIEPNQLNQWQQERKWLQKSKNKHKLEVEPHSKTVLFLCNSGKRNVILSIKWKKGCLGLETKATKKNLFFFSFVFVILCLFIVVFILTANEIRRNQLISFDNMIISLVQGNITPLLTGTAETFTFLGSTKWITCAVLVGIIVLFISKKWSLGLFLLLSSGLGSLFNVLLKDLFKRQRPDIHPLITEHGYSFPSGHSMGSFIFYGALAYIIIHYTHRRGWKVIGATIMAILIFLIGISRIYLGVHYPSDVVGGFTAGGAWLFICIIVYRYYEYRKNL